MLLTIRYCKGYGWHVGRPIVWCLLLLMGVPAAFLAAFLEAALRPLNHLPIPFALIAPAVLLLVLWGRLKHKFNGKPFAVCLPKFFLDDTPTLLIPRGDRHFRALVIIESPIRGSVVAIQTAIIWSFHAR